MKNLVSVRGHESSSSSFSYCGCDVVVSGEFVEVFEICPNDPYELNCVTTKDHGLDHTKVDLVDNFPPNIIKDELYAFDNGYLSD